MVPRKSAMLLPVLIVDMFPVVLIALSALLEVNSVAQQVNQAIDAEKGKNYLSSSHPPTEYSPPPARLMGEQVDSFPRQFPASIQNDSPRTAAFLPVHGSIPVLLY